jgi:thiosulfate/3-mercaptopyruvate sulfurtransferase
MKKSSLITFLAIALIMLIANIGKINSQEVWSKNQLLAPADLNKIVNNPKAPKYYIYSIGYQAVIKNSIDVGAGSDKENQKKISKLVSKLPKDANIVIYCGCCPFERCPNVRPIFKLLNDLGFKNHKLLNLPQNIKVDWIDKGYSVKK